MSAGGLFWLMICGFVVTMLSAIAAWVVKSISWHELEEYCKLKKQPELFGHIFDLREQMQLGSEILQNISTAVMAFGAIGWLLQSRQFVELTGQETLVIIGLLAFGLVFASSWVPWAVARTGSVEFLFQTWRGWWIVSAYFYSADCSWSTSSFWRSRWIGCLTRTWWWLYFSMAGCSICHWLFSRKKY